MYSIGGAPYHQFVLEFVDELLFLSYFKSLNIDAFTPMWKV
jgi:hypothetical protein